jgi:hypothetical protein
MTYTGGEYSQENLFEELKRQSKAENIKSYDEYVELVDNLVEEKISYGFFLDQEDTEQIKSDLAQRWSEIERRMR